MPTIETCFNCFGIHSSDAREIIKKDNKTNREIKNLRNLSRPPPPSVVGKGESTKWRQCLKENFFPPHTARYRIKGGRGKWIPIKILLTCLRFPVVGVPEIN